MCTFLKADGNQCKLSPKKGLCHRHINSVTDEKKEGSEFKSVQMDIVDIDIVPPTPMSPNATPTSPPHVIVDGGNSNSVKINCQPLFESCKSFLKENAVGTWHETFAMKKKGTETYLHKPMRDMSLLCVEHEEGSLAKVMGSRRFYWLYNSKDAKAFNEHVARKLKAECHEVFVSPRTRFFFDIDLKLDEFEKNDLAEAMGYHLEEGCNEEILLGNASEKLAKVYRDAIAISLEEHGALDDLEILDWMATTRNRALDNDGFKISIHLITNLVLSHAACSAIATHVQDHAIIENAGPLGIPESITSLVAEAIDPAQYRKHGSLGLPHGVKAGNISWVIKEYNVVNQSYFLTKMDQYCIEDVDMSNYEIKTVSVFTGVADGDFIKQALSHVDSIPDYSADVFDIGASHMKGSVMFLKRYKPSLCSFCKRTHDNDNTLKIFFNSELGFATWECIRSKDKSRRFFAIEASPDDEDIEAFAARNTKPEEVKPEEVKPEEVKPVEVKPVETKPTRSKPVVSMDDEDGGFLDEDFEESSSIGEEIKSDEVKSVEDLKNDVDNLEKKCKQKALDCLSRFVKAIRELNPNIVREENGLEFNDLAMKADADIFKLKDLATLICQTVVRVENNGESSFFVKVLDERKYGREYVWTITYVPRAKSNLQEYKYKVSINDTVISLKLLDILGAIKSSINHRKVVMEPFGAFDKDNTYERRKNFNIFGGFVNQYDKAFVVDENIVNVWLHHLNLVLANNNDAVFQHLLKYFTHLIKNPMIKTGLVLIVKGLQGSGKNAGFDIFFRYVLGANLSLTTASMDLVTGRFNSIKQSLIACCLDEAIDNKDKPLMNKFKNLITADEQQIEYKGKEPFTIKDFVNYVVISNNDFATFIEESDRRALCMKTNDMMIGNREYFANYWGTLDNEEAGKHIFHWLLNNVDIDGWNPQDIPRTEYKQTLKRIQAPSHAKFLLDELDRLEAGNISPDGYEYNDTEYAALSSEFRERISGPQILTPTELWDRYNSYVIRSKMKASMSRASFDKEIQTYIATQKSQGRRVKRYCKESLRESLNAYL